MTVRSLTSTPANSCGSLWLPPIDHLQRMGDCCPGPTRTEFFLSLNGDLGKNAASDGANGLPLRLRGGLGHNFTWKQTIEGHDYASLW